MHNYYNVLSVTCLKHIYYWKFISIFWIISHTNINNSINIILLRKSYKKNIFKPWRNQVKKCKKKEKQQQNNNKTKQNTYKYINKYWKISSSFMFIYCVYTTFVWICICFWTPLSCNQLKWKLTKRRRLMSFAIIFRKSKKKRKKEMKKIYKIISTLHLNTCSCDFFYC